MGHLAAHQRAAISSERPLLGADFGRLSARARILERSALALVAVIAIVPPLLVFFQDLHAVREQARQDALHVSRLVQAYVRESQVDRPALKKALDQVAADSSVGLIRVYDGNGGLLVGTRTGSGPQLIQNARLNLPAAASPLQSVEVGIDASRVMWRGMRAVVIHIAVATALGIGLYRLPVRALRSAIAELETAQLQMVHQDRLATLGEMYAAVTHEVGNPLGIILARVRMLLADARDTGMREETVRDLEVVERHGQRIAEIIRSLLAFARKPDLERRETDLNQVVREVLLLVEKPLAHQDIRVVAALAGTPLPLEASPQHLQHVLLNLVNNARDAMPGGGTLTLRTAASRESVSVEVEDTGVGLAPWVESRVFEPFFTTKEVGKGTGLGLSVSYGIARAHGGDLTARNAPDGGALFRLTLPRGEGHGV